MDSGGRPWEKPVSEMIRSSAQAACGSRCPAAIQVVVRNGPLILWHRCGCDLTGSQDPRGEWASPAPLGKQTGRDMRVE